MTRRLGLLLPLLLIAPAPAHAADPAGCLRAGERVVASGDAAVVTRAREGRLHVFRACATATGRRAVLTRGPHAYGPQVGPFAIRGRRVAFGVPTGERRTGSGWDLGVTKAGTRRSRWFLPLPAQPRQLAVDAEGRVAVRTRTTIELADPAGPRQVDAAVPGALSDLRVEGDTARWRHGDAERSAPLALPSACPARDDVYLDTQGAGAVAGSAPGRPGEAPGFAVLCRFTGGGWIDLGPGEALLAGELVGVQRGLGARAAVHVRRVADLARVREPVRVGFGEWALGADGTVVVASPNGRRLHVHPPTGAGFTIATGSGWLRWFGIDDAAGRVAWIGDEGTGSASLSGARGPCGGRDEELVTQGDDLVVVRRRIPDRGDDDTAFIACRPATGERRRVAYSGDSWDSGTSVSAIAVGGSLVAWVSYSSVRGNGTTSIYVRDFDRPDEEPSTVASLAAADAEALAVSPTGRIAVLDGPSLLVVDDAGYRRVDVAVPGSITDLAFAGDELVWRHSGQERRIVAPLPAPCDPPEGVIASVQTPLAASGARVVRRRGAEEREIPAVCVFPGGGWTELPGEGPAQTAGTYVASRTDGQVTVRDLATLAAVRSPIASGRTWGLLSDGSVLVAGADGYALHHLDGTTTTWQPDPVSGVLVDEVARAIVWRSYQRPVEWAPIP